MKITFEHNFKGKKAKATFYLSKKLWKLFREEYGRYFDWRKTTVVENGKSRKADEYDQEGELMEFLFYCLLYGISQGSFPDVMNDDLVFAKIYGKNLTKTYKKIRGLKNDNRAS